MPSISLNRPNAYLNIGSSREWRRCLANQEISLWLRTKFQRRCCLVSLASPEGEIFSIELNTRSGQGDEGQCGLRVTARDAVGVELSGETAIPALTDDRWHLVHIRICDGNSIAFHIDGIFVTTEYLATGPLGPLNTETHVRQVYPAYDLVGARNNKGEVQDYFIGKLSDISVSTLEGQRVHWWVFDTPRGSTVWDRNEATRTIAGRGTSLHLQSCNCAWDETDAPPSGLYINGLCGITLASSYLTGFRVEQLMLGAQFRARMVDLEDSFFPKEVDPEMSTGELVLAIPPDDKDSGTDEGDGDDSSSLASEPTPKDGTVSMPQALLLPTVIPPSPDQRSKPLSPKPLSPMNMAANAMRSPTNLLTIPKSPQMKFGDPGESITLFPESTKHAAGSSARQRFAFKLHIRTTTSKPALLLSVPLPGGTSAHVALNTHDQPNFSLILGQHAMVVNQDIANDEWHEISCVLDASEGTVITIDTVLATWESQDLGFNADELSGAAASTMPPAGMEHSNNNYAMGISVASTSPAHATGFGSASTNLQASTLYGGSTTMRPALQVATPRDESIDVPVANWSFQFAPKQVGGSALERLLAKAFDQAITLPPELPAKLLSQIEEHPKTSSRDRAMIEELRRGCRGVVIGNSFDGLIRDVELVFGETSMEWQFHSLPKGPSRPTATRSLSHKRYLVREVVPRFFTTHLVSLAEDLGLKRSTRRSVGQAMESSSMSQSNPHANKASGPHTTPHHHQACIPIPGYSAQEVESMIVSPHRTAAQLINLVSTLSVQGRFTLAPKSTLRHASCQFKEGQAATLTGVPIELDTSVSVAFFARIDPATGDLVSKGYGPLMSLHGVLRIVAIRERIVLLVPSVGVDRAGSSDKNSNAAVRKMSRSDNDLSPETRSRSSSISSEAIGATQLLRYSAFTTLLEDGNWHRLRVFLPHFPPDRNTPGHRAELWVDENPMEFALDRAAKRSQRRHSSLADGDLNLGRSPVQVFNPDTPNAGGGNVFTLIDGFQIPATPVADTVVLEGESILKQEFESLRQRLTATNVRTSPRRGVVPTTNATLGGRKFRGSFARIKITSGRYMPIEWLMDEGAGNKLSRHPLTTPAAVAMSPGNSPQNTDSPNALMASSTSPMTHPMGSLSPMSVSMPLDGMSLRSPKSRGTQEAPPSEITVRDPVWRVSRLPEMGLQLDGRNGYVDSVGLNHSVSAENLNCFTVSLWFLDSGTGFTKPSCLLSIHDKVYPQLDCSVGIYLHTRINTATSPKTRVSAPYVTSFILCDSSERYLVLETDSDLFDGLWHKIEWCVENARENRTHIKVDDRLLEVAPVCREHPSRFVTHNENLTLNVGARNEGDGGVHYHCSGNVRDVRIKGPDGDELLHWALDEGKGNVARDDLDAVVGRIYGTQWEMTSLPPLTPNFDIYSSLEVSPIADLNTVFDSGVGLRIQLTLKTSSKDMGTVATLVDLERNPVVSMTLNEGGSIRRSMREAGTHRVRVASLDGDARVQHTYELVSNELTDGLWHHVTIVVTNTGSCKVWIDEVVRAVLKVSEIHETQQLDTPRLTKAPSLGRVASLHHRRTPGGSAVSSPRGASSNEDITFGARLTAGDHGWNLTRGSSFGTEVFNPDEKKSAEIVITALILGKCGDRDGACTAIKNVVIGEWGDVTSILFLPLAKDSLCVSAVHRNVASANLQWELTIPPLSCLMLEPGRHVQFGYLRTLQLQRFSFSCDLRLQHSDTWATAPPSTECLLNYGHDHGSSLRVVFHENAAGLYELGTIHVALLDSEDGAFELDCHCEEFFSGDWKRFELRVLNATQHQAEIYINDVPQVIRYGTCSAPCRFDDAYMTGTIGALVREDASPAMYVTGHITHIQFADVPPLLAAPGAQPAAAKLHAKWDLRTGYGSVLCDTSGNRLHAVARSPLWHTLIHQSEMISAANKQVKVKSSGVTVSTPPSRVSPGEHRFSLVDEPSSLRRHSRVHEWRRNTATLNMLEQRNQATEASQRRTVTIFENDDPEYITPADGEGYIPRAAVDVVPQARIWVTRWSNNPSADSCRDEKTGLFRMDAWPEDGWRSGTLQCPQCVIVEFPQLMTVFLLSIILPKSCRGTIFIQFSRGTVDDEEPHEAAGGLLRGCTTTVRTLNMTRSTNRLIVVRFAEPYFHVKTVKLNFQSSSAPPSIDKFQVFAVPNNFDLRRKYTAVPVHAVTPRTTPSHEAASLSQCSSPSTNNNTLTDVSPRADDEAKAFAMTRSIVRHSYELLPTTEAIRRFNELDVDRTLQVNKKDVVQYLVEWDPLGLLTGDAVLRELEASGCPRRSEVVTLDQFRICFSRLSRQ